MGESEKVNEECMGEQMRNEERIQRQDQSLFAYGYRQKERDDKVDDTDLGFAHSI